MNKKYKFYVLLWEQTCWIASDIFTGKEKNICRHRSFCSGDQNGGWK
jgi:hypothetical protein